TEGFQFDEALQRTANEDFTRRGIAATTYAWVLRGPEQAGVVILMVMKGAGGSESALRDLGRGLKRGTGQEGGRIIEDTMEWSPDAHEYRLGMLQRGVYIRSRCMSSQRSAAASSQSPILASVSPGRSVCESTSTTRSGASSR